MDNPYSKLPDNQLTRNFGGTTKGAADPLITGYHFITFSKLPAFLVTSYGDRTPGDRGTLRLSDMQNILSAAALAVTLPSSRLNHVDLTGLGGIKWTVPTNIDIDTSFNVKFLEFGATPIYNIIHAWIQLIRSYNTGLSAFSSGKNTDNKYNYAGTAYYFTTSPDLQDINFFACFDGIYPVIDPSREFGHDIETIGKLDIEIEFKFDYMWVEKWVYNNCKVFLSALQTQKREFLDKHALT